MNLEHEAEELVFVTLDDGTTISPTKTALWYTLLEAKYDGFMEAMAVFRGMSVYYENIAYAAEFEQRMLRKRNEMILELTRLKDEMEKVCDEASGLPRV